MSVNDDPRGPPPEEPGPEAQEVSRRRFLKYAALGGAGTALAALGAGYLTGAIRIGGAAPPPWEVSPGVVDYSKVPIPGAGSDVTLRIAQWFDYWPGSFLADSSWSFATYMKDTYGINVRYQIDYFTSMEELFLWVSPLGKKEYDVFVPASELEVLFDHAGWVYNLEEDWLPNLTHLDGSLLGKPASDPWERRPDGSLRSVPYFWGTTGIAYNTDYLDRPTVEGLGWELFWQPDVLGYDLRGKMNMLNEMRDVLLIGFKQAGWNGQAAEGRTPSGELPPDGTQWTSNETDPARVKAAKDLLLQARPNLFDFNSTNVIPSLQTRAALANHSWSGDAMLAATPDARNPWPIDYVIPKQGTRWWIDAMAIHSKAKNIWVAHEFLNFIHDPEVMKNLAYWNRYSSTNLTARSLMTPLGDSEWDIANDPRLYPDAATWKRLDLSVDVGAAVLETLYNPAWNELKFGG